MTPGEVITAFLAVLMGSFSLGQVGPQLEAVAKGM